MHTAFNSRTRMKLRFHLLLFSGFFLLPFVLLAQGFDKEGIYKPANGNQSLYDPSKLTGSVPGTAPSIKAPTFVQTPASSNADMVKSFKTRLLDRVNVTLYNLQNDSLGLKKVYEAIWPGFYTDYIKQLKALKTYLAGGGGIPASAVLPTKVNIDAWNAADFYGLRKDDQLTTNDVLAFELLQNDPMAAWLNKTYGDDLHADAWLSKQEMDIDYVTKWRNLEAMLKKTLEAKAWAKSIRDDIFKYDQDKYDEYNKALTAINVSNDPLVKLIQKSTFLKKWLWYEGGVPGIDPLLVTTDDKKYPGTEVNSYFTADKRKLQDTLDKAQTSILTKFGQLTKYANLLFLPQVNALNKDKIYLLEINAHDSYNAFDPIADSKLEKNKLMLAVYNIPGDKKVSITSSTDKLVYQSAFSIALGTIADQISTLTAITSPNLAVFTKLSTSLNPPVLAPVQLGVANPNTGSQRSLARHLDDSTKLISWTTVNGHYVPLSGKYNEDKKRILLAGTLKPSDETINNYSAETFKLIDQFIIEDAAVALDYTTRPLFNKCQNSLNVRFNSFEKKIAGWYKNISDLSDFAKTKFEAVDPFLRISNRSLPPDPIKSSIDTVPVLRTLLNTPITPDPPSKLIYMLTEQSGKDKSPAKQVVKQSLNVIQTQRFDFSVGIGYTFPEYQISAPGTPLPTSTIGDNFQFIAGAHWYFINRLNKLHDGIGRYTDERFSLYAGLSIAHALDNYYAGLSYDIVPGVRLIGGCHFYKNYHFNILNNSVADQASGISTAGFFMSLNLEPIIVGKSIGLFK